MLTKVHSHHKINCPCFSYKWSVTLRNKAWKFFIKSVVTHFAVIILWTGIIASNVDSISEIKLTADWLWSIPKKLYLTLQQSFFLTLCEMRCLPQQGQQFFGSSQGWSGWVQEHFELIPQKTKCDEWLQKQAYLPIPMMATRYMEEITIVNITKRERN